MEKKENYFDIDTNFCRDFRPLFVVNSTSRALPERTKESDTIIGV